MMKQIIATNKAPRAIGLTLREPAVINWSLLPASWESIPQPVSWRVSR